MESKSKFPLWLALTIYVWLCVVVFVVVVGYLSPINTPKDYNTLENIRRVYIEAR
jgi:hypothetical protein